MCFSYLDDMDNLEDIESRIDETNLIEVKSNRRCCLCCCIGSRRSIQYIREIGRRLSISRTATKSERKLSKVTGAPLEVIQQVVRSKTLVHHT